MLAKQLPSRALIIYASSGFLKIDGDVLVKSAHERKNYEEEGSRPSAVVCSVSWLVFVDVEMFVQ